MLLLGAGAADRELLLALYAADEPWISLGAIGLTQLGGAKVLIPLALLGALWLLSRRRPLDGLILLAAVLVGKLLVLLQKAWLGRLRPDENMRLVEVSNLSFPSGHAANSMIFYLTFALLLFVDPRERRIAAACAVALSLLIGLSRPLLGVHWPSDVVGGWAFGLLWVMLCLAAARTLKRSVSRAAARG